MARTSREPDILAAEFVLGTLDAGERARAEKRRGEDEAFARAVARWEQRLRTLGETVPEVAAPHTLWPRLEAAIAGAESPAAVIQAQIARLSRRLAAWRLAAAGSAAVAALALVLWIGAVGAPTPSPAPPAAERYVAMLTGAERKMGFLVTVEPEAKRMLIRVMAPRAPEAKSYELWLIRKDGTKPETLGVIRPAAFTTMDLPEPMQRQTLDTGIQLAISLEQEGGAPPGQPMGAVLFAGDLMKQTP